MSDGETSKMTDPLVKKCPRCGRIAALAASQCENCGRQYRTQYAAPPNRTQVIPSGLAPGDWPHAASTAVTIAPPLTPPVAIVREAERQFHHYTWMRIISILCIPAFGLGIIGWLVFNQLEMNLRTRVAALGLDAEAWEAPLKMQRWQMFWRFARACGIILLACFMIGVISSVLLSRAQKQTAATRSTLEIGREITPGMLGARVLEILGKPDSSQRAGEDTENWNYATADGGVTLTLRAGLADGFGIEAWHVVGVRWSEGASNSGTQ